MIEKSIIKENEYDESKKEILLKRRKTNIRLYDICRQSSYNTKTCSETVEIDSSSSFDKNKLI